MIRGICYHILREYFHLISRGKSDMNTMPYYENQANWTSNEFYCLHRYLHRMFFYYNKRIDEIKSIQTNKLSTETKVLIYCIVKYYNLVFLFDLENLKDLKKCKPLENPLIIDGDTASDDDVYKKMNVIF